MDSHEEYQEILRQLPMTCGQPDLHRAYIEAGSICSICESIEVIKIEKLNEDRFANKVARRVVELMKVEIMSTKTEGGPAYPLPVNDEQCRARFESGYGGMTLRDYFAAKALPMCMTADESAKTVAEMAYSMADAMLKAREEK